VRKLHAHLQKFVIASALCFICTGLVRAQDPELTREQMKHFLLTAKVVKSRQTTKGITNPWRLTLSDGTITHDGGFQAIDERRNSKQFQDGTTEFNYVDS